MNHTIPGIYNYCDRWCEKCPLSHRCLLFLQQLEAGSGVNDLEAAENHFLDELDSLLENQNEEIEEYNSDYEELAPDDEIFHPKANDDEDVGSQVRKSQLLQLCGLYRELMKPFLDILIPERIHTFILKTENSENKFQLIQEHLDTLRYYLFFFEAKFYRALSGKISGDEVRFEPNYPTDSEASAKIGMICVDKCRRAVIDIWDLFYSREQDQAIFHALSLLDQIKKESLKEFPQAPFVKRPGFDR